MLKIYKAQSYILIPKKSNDSITKSQIRGQQAKGNKAISPDTIRMRITGYSLNAAQSDMYSFDRNDRNDIIIPQTPWYHYQYTNTLVPTTSSNN